MLKWMLLSKLFQCIVFQEYAFKKKMKLVLKSFLLLQIPIISLELLHKKKPPPVLENGRLNLKEVTAPGFIGYAGISPSLRSSLSFLLSPLLFIYFCFSSSKYDRFAERIRKFTVLFVASPFWAVNGIR
jgi:hypothetical protein